MRKKNFIYFILCVSGILCILLFLKCSFKENVDNKKETMLLEEKKQEQLVETLNDLKQKGYRIIEDQSFNVDFKNYPNSRFISSRIQEEGLFQVAFYLVDKNNNIIYRFPDFYGNSFGYIENIKAVSFVDINKDNRKDVIIIAEYVIGAGPEGMIPRPVADIYIQQDKKFITDLELNEKINILDDDTLHNTTIASILEYLKELHYFQ